MNNLILALQILTAIFLILAILVQSKGTGFSRNFNSQASFSRRGLEKIVFKATFVVGIIFILVSVVRLVV